MPICTGVCLLGLLLSALGIAAEPAAPQPGSPEYRPSPERPVGWRGDGTGKYPGANPPLHWGRSLKQQGELKCAAVVPKDDGARDAAPPSLGYFAEWLVAGPVKCADPVKAIKEELTPGEASLAPHAGDKLGEATWRVVKVEGSCFDVWKTLGGMTKEHAAYLQACLYTARPLKIWFYVKYGRGAALWLNGAPIHSNVANYPGWAGLTLLIDLQPGWNRFLFKVVPRVGGGTDFPSGCYVTCGFWPAEEPRDYEEKNIAWIAPMPGLSQAMPIIVGDRIFTTAHPYNLISLDKKSGKILWIRPNSPYDAATADERKAKPELFAKMDDLAAKRDAYYRDYTAGKLPDAEGVRDETDLENELDKLMVEVDRKYKRPNQQGEPDWWTIPTPASDGRSVCVWLTRGVSACYDPDGNRRWIGYTRPKDQHHGYFTSPVIADGKFIRYDGRITAFDLADGSVKWSIDDGWKEGHDSPLWFGSLTRCVVGGTEYVLWLGTDMVRARDGQVFHSKPWRVHGDSTPIFDKDIVLQTHGAEHGAEISAYRVKPAADAGVTIERWKAVKWPYEALLGGPNHYQGHWLEASPLVHEGLGYAVSWSGVLAVFDMATMERVYEKKLPVGGSFGTSVTLAGQYIYLMGAGGTAVVIKPGRTYDEVASNSIQFLCQAAFFPEGQRKLYKGRTMGRYGMFLWNPRYCPEGQESTMTSTPIFDGNRMYFRGQENLYCIGEK